MRVTNTMMRNNSMLNMQKNKVAYNKYLTQYNTQKKYRDHRMIRRLRHVPSNIVQLWQKLISI